MEQLDLVYSTFANLERNYSRSKKSRSEYIKDKFGGDIPVGSFLILNALSAEEFSDPEDIRKFSEIRAIFDKLLENKDRLDSLASFNFDMDSDGSMSALDVLNLCQDFGTGVTVVEQGALYNGEAGVMQFDVRSEEVRIAPAKLSNTSNFTRYIKMCNRGMVAFFGQFVPDSSLDLGSVVERKNLGLSFTVATAVEL